jgi:hypothetical protein
VVWPSHHRDSQNKYNLEKINLEWSGPLSPTWCPKLLQPRKNKCRVFWPSHHREAQKILRPRKNKCKVVWPSHLWHSVIERERVWKVMDRFWKIMSKTLFSYC